MAVCVTRKCKSTTWKSDSSTVINKLYVEMNSSIPFEKSEELKV